MRHRGRLVFWCVLCGLLMTLGICLGLWQWQRAADKREWLEAMANAPLVESPRGAPAEGSEIVIEGRFLGGQTLFLDNRTLNGRLGVGVLVPLMDEYGQRWLVDRGFLETGMSRATPAVSTPEGTVRITGRWQSDGRQAPVFGENLEGQRLQQIEPAAWQQGFSFDGWVHQHRGNGQLPVWWTPNVMPPERHTAYAVQWWSLATVAFIALLVGARRLNADRRRLGRTRPEELLGRGRSVPDKANSRAGEVRG
ncbi:SURF1 family protein [Halomonas cupida]|uniref:SURF1 family protein n=1 Tax=Halomonas cupida TaxID=44933 RepID=UPI0039B42BA4